MVSQALYSPRSDGRQNYRTAHNPYHYLAERRSYPGSLPQHNIRVMTMTDQGESDSSSQRKRISVAVSLHLATLQHSQHTSLQRASLSRLNHLLFLLLLRKRKHTSLVRIPKTTNIDLDPVLKLVRKMS
jgi:hypothetical protein